MIVIAAVIQRARRSVIVHLFVNHIEGDLTSLWLSRGEQKIKSISSPSNHQIVLVHRSFSFFHRKAIFRGPRGRHCRRAMRISSPPNRIACDSHFNTNLVLSLKCTPTLPSVKAYSISYFLQKSTQLTMKLVLQIEALRVAKKSSGSPSIEGNR